MFKRKDIEQMFTDTVSEYIKNGYRFYYSSMGGSQGEIAKVDLTNGKEVIRILLSHEHEDFWFDYIALIVGRNTDRLYGQFHDIIWNNNLEIISEVKFYEIGNNRNYNCFGTKQEAIDAHKKHMERLHSRKFDDDITTFNFPDKAKEIVLPFVKRQYKCKSITLKQIEEVKKIVRYSYSNNKKEVHYYVTAKGKTYRIN